ncbi:hypothetical protein [Musicola paradisiaca]|uniref:Uncharacterized protein n=1 Tax=Musicola paradisiaca (strain Ech703) TaxID=579405 RepID=C6CD99_MUSP7|nr:hypothetical protein [Musicola paradisiaca]ACS86970.1 hypothetical protein Dd703_3206 [Musicola paradisiaca Ech703]
MSSLNGVNSPRVYFDEVMLFVDSCFQHDDGKLVVYLEAGHYNHRFGVDDFSLNTLNDAVEFGYQLIKKYQKNVKLVYGILIDDLGMACSDHSCTLTPASEPSQEKGGADLPDEIDIFIAANPLIKRDKLMIFSERTSKNRAIESIKKKIKQGSEGLMINDDEAGSEIKIALGKETPFLFARRQGEVFTAKCPAIISQHYKDVVMKLKQRFFESNNFIIIDWSEISDRTKVIQGKSALPIIQDDDLVNLTIVNVFFGDDEGQIVDVKCTLPQNHHCAETVMN